MIHKKSLLRCDCVLRSAHKALNAAVLQKTLQLYQIQKLNHGLMLVGPTGVGKTSAWSILLEAMEVIDGVSGVSHIINPKAISKDKLYGKLDNTTLEWTDGIFTSILRKIINSYSSKVNRLKSP